MIKLAAVSFLAAATLGITMAVMGQKKKPLPASLPIAHGIFAVAGLLSLGITAFQPDYSVIVSVVLGLFVLAAIGGLLVYNGYRQTNELAVGMVIMHGTLATLAMVFLLGVVYAQSVMKPSTPTVQLHSGPNVE
jgi:hypothetical protein